MRISNIALICLASALVSVNGHALSALSQQTGQPSNAAPAKKKGGMPKFIPSASQESTRERERRLLRECKGRPNAGACSGFAS